MRRAQTLKRGQLSKGQYYGSISVMHAPLSQRRGSAEILPNLLNFASMKRNAGGLRRETGWVGQ